MIASRPMSPTARPLTGYQRFRMWLEFDAPWKLIIAIWFAGCAIFIATHQGNKLSDDAGRQVECHRGMNVTDDCDY